MGTPGKPPPPLKALFYLQDWFPTPHLMMGDVETWWLKNEIEKVEVHAPIFVCGLARSGTTVALKFISEHEQATTHTYFDQLSCFMPGAVNWLGSRVRFPKDITEGVDRIHKDGLKFAPFEPEATEEMLWQAEFPDSHDEKKVNVMTKETSNPSFERRYDDMIRKLLYMREKERYVAKNNYAVTRTDYIFKLYPDAKFVLCVRHPLTHIASTLKSHNLIYKLQTSGEAPFFETRMRMVAHYEFGKTVKFINVGDGAAEKARALWNEDGVAGGFTTEARVKRVKALAIYWASIHRYLANKLKTDKRFKDSTMVVRHEDLCADPAPLLDKIFDHCKLGGPSAEKVKEKYRTFLRAPDYYKPSFTKDEFETLREYTQDAAALLGYTPDSWKEFEVQFVDNSN